MSTVKKKRVAIIEPSPVIRLGIKSLLEDHMPELSVAKTCDDLRAFQESIPDPALDMILLNPAVINFHKRFNVRDLFPDYPEAAVVAILYGYVDPETLNSFDGILDIYDDGKKIAAKLKKIAKEFTGQTDGISGENVTLSEREKEILVAITKGMTNKKIADKHSISIHTVISHRKNITRKTGIKTVSGLTIYAILNNLVSQKELQNQ